MQLVQAEGGRARRCYIAPMVITRAPCPALQAHVRLLWAATACPGASVTREHVLPTGDMHLAFRMGGPSLRVYASPSDNQGLSLGQAVVGGARSRFHARAACGAASVGAMLAPGAALALLGAPADALAGCHTPLAGLWGAHAEYSLDALSEAAGPEAQLDALERILLQRLNRATDLSPAVACVLARLRAGSSVGDAVAETGLSHRHVLTLFRQSTGIAPKQYAGVLRMQRLLRRAARPGSPGWAELALQAGFCDQSHFNRDFLAFAGVTPRAWRRAAVAHPNHVPVAGR